MGNSSSSNSTDPLHTSIPGAEDIFKVDNINSCGRKHAVAKIQVSSDNICIRQKHRQPLYIPLETIKRYGLDGSIFILECGRRAPLGQARYAFRCKQARRLVDCLDQRITIRSRQLLEQQRRGTALSPSSPLTTVAPSSHQRRGRRTQSDQGLSRRAPSSILLSSSSTASVSFASRATFSCRNSVPNLSENYFPFDALPCGAPDDEENGQSMVRQKQPADMPDDRELHYVEFKSESVEPATDKEDVDAPIRREKPAVESRRQSPALRGRRRSLPSRLNQQHRSSRSETMNPTVTDPYVYIDHEKTITLTEVANKRLQHQQQVRHVEV